MVEQAAHFMADGWQKEREAEQDTPLKGPLTYGPPPPVPLGTHQ